MRRATFLILWSLTLAAGAQWLPSYGGERAGQASYSFLKSDYHIASAAMGSVGSVLGGDARSLGYNPAGLARTKGFSAAFASLGNGSGLEQGSAFVANKVRNLGKEALQFVEVPRRCGRARRALFTIAPYRDRQAGPLRWGALDAAVATADLEDRTRGCSVAEIGIDAV